MLLTFLMHSGEQMDKASIVSDAISYVQNLQNRVDKIQEDIVDLETRKEGAAVVGSGDEDPRRNYSIVSFQKKIKKEHRIVEVCHLSHF